MPRLIPLVFMLLAPLAVARSGDLLRTPECLAALAALTQEEDSVMAGRTAAAPAAIVRPSKLPGLRRAAARACLGSADAQTPMSATRSPTPAALPGAARPATATNLRVRPSVNLAPATAPARQAPGLTITSCDFQGCWASDGTRVQRLGPMLLGPTGYCTQVGTFLNCP